MVNKGVPLLINRSSSFPRETACSQKRERTGVVPGVDERAPFLLSLFQFILSFVMVFSAMKEWSSYVLNMNCKVIHKTSLSYEIKICPSNTG